MLQIGGYVAGLSAHAAVSVRWVVATVCVLPMGDKRKGLPDRLGQNVVKRLTLERPALSFQGSCLVHLKGGVGTYQVVVDSELEDEVGQRWGPGGEASQTTLIVRVAPPQ